MGLLGTRRWRSAPEHEARSSLHSDSFDAYIARNREGLRYAALLMIFSATAAVTLLVVAVITDSQAAGLALAIPIVFFAYAFEQWEDARGGREALRHDVIALSNVLYQDLAMINKMLEDEMIREYLQNLLQAALNDEEFGRAYWDQAVLPFLAESRKGFREDWRYRIDLAQLESTVEVPLERGAIAIDPGDFWRLATVASYRQQVKRPWSECYIGATFSLEHLPEWFRDDGFLLRELVSIAPEHREALASTFSDRWVELDDEEGDRARAAADALFACDLQIGGRRLQAAAIQISDLGIRRRYLIDEELRASMAAPVGVRIGVKSFQPRSQTFFPVNLTVPTRHPTIQFTYCRTGLPAAAVGANVFFSAERPYRPELVEHDEEAGRIDIQTDREDWVFAGSGCMFSWNEQDLAAAD